MRRQLLILALACGVFWTLPPAAVAAAGTSVALAKLRVGVAVSPRSRPARSYEPFRAYLADKLGFPVEVVPFRDGQSLVEAAAARRVDYAIFTAATFAMTWRLCGCFEPLAAPRSDEGSMGFHAIVVARNDSTLSGPADLAGKTIAASDTRSVAGRLVPVSELAIEGTDIAAVAARIDTVRGPDAAVMAVIERRADAGLAWSSLEGETGDGYSRGTLHDLVAARRLDMHDVRIIWKSALIPNGPHAIRSDLSPDFKTHLQRLLTDLAEQSPETYDSVEPIFGGGFAQIRLADYLPMLRLVTMRGQDPLQPPPDAPRP